MATYTIMGRVTVGITRDIKADSLAHAVELSKSLKVSHFVQPAKGADTCFDDYENFEIYGVYKS